MLFQTFLERVPRVPNLPSLVSLCVALVSIAAISAFNCSRGSFTFTVNRKFRSVAASQKGRCLHEAEGDEWCYVSFLFHLLLFFTSWLIM